MIHPEISVIIPAFNEEKRITSCIESIKNQNYNGRTEIIVVDDDSTDNTRNIARELGCTVCKNGSHNIERGKSIGLENASYDFIFLIDADNILPDKDWLQCAMDAFLENDNVAGVEASKFTYDASHAISDRYCELFGINDPTVYYLKRQDKLKWTDDKWVLKGNLIKENENYYLVEYNAENLVTVGSQGFLTKKSLLLNTNHTPYLFHMDSNLELVDQGYNRFVFLKKSVIHLHSDSVNKIVHKLKRNMKLFQEHATVRRFKYDINFMTMLKIGVIMGTAVIPLFDSIRGFLKKRDIAWFLHPILCVWISVLYANITINAKLHSQREKT